MEPEATEKKQVRVTILNQTYTLTTTGEPEEMEQLARQVDELMTGIASRSHNLDNTRVAVLACLHLADQLRGMEGEIAQVRRSFHQKAREFSLLLNQAIEPAER